MVNVTTVSHNKIEMFFLFFAGPCNHYDALNWLIFGQGSWVTLMGIHTQFGSYPCVCLRDLKRVLEPLVKGPVTLWGSYVTCPPL